MEAFDEPAIGIEGDPLLGLGQAVDGQGGQQQPVNGRFAGGRLAFNHVNDLHAQARAGRLGAFRAAQRQRAEAYLHLRRAGLTLRAASDGDGFLSRNGRKRNRLE